MANNPLIYCFMYDKAFANNIALQSPSSEEIGNLCIPSNLTNSYFKNPCELKDSRDIRPWIDPDSINKKVRASLLLDKEVFSEFVNKFIVLPKSDRDSVFHIIDTLTILNKTNRNEKQLETLLISDSNATVYKPKSLTVSKKRTDGKIYSDIEAIPTLVTFPNWVQFTVSVAGKIDPIEHTIKIWFNDSSFIKEYPLSHITEIISYLDYNEILLNALTGQGYNSFLVSANAADVISSKVSPALKLSPQSGLYNQHTTLYDSSGNTYPYKFGILYKGTVPDLLDIRTAIRNKLLTSSTGTESSWKKRIPELFITNQFYIIPMWDVTTELPNLIIYPSVGKLSDMIKATKIVMPFMSSKYVNDNVETMSVIYDTIITTVIAHVENINHKNIISVHPTYQTYTAAEPGFADMSEHTKVFVNKLNEAMAVAAGKVNSLKYLSIEEDGAKYISFVVDDTEYYIMTKASYISRMDDSK